MMFVLYFILLENCSIASRATFTKTFSPVFKMQQYRRAVPKHIWL